MRPIYKKEKLGHRVREGRREEETVVSPKTGTGSKNV